MVVESKSAIKTKQSWNYVIFMLNCKMAAKILHKHRLDYEHLYWDEQHLLFGMMCWIVCQCRGWQIKKLSSSTLSKRWHPSPWLMTMAEDQVFSGSSIITDNNYAINLSLATQDNKGKQDFSEQWAFRQPAVGTSSQVPDRWSHL